MTLYAIDKEKLEKRQILLQPPLKTILECLEPLPLKAEERCTKCNGARKVNSPSFGRTECYHCNGTGKEPIDTNSQDSLHSEEQCIPTVKAGQVQVTDYKPGGLDFEEEVCNKCPHRKSVHNEPTGICCGQYCKCDKYVPQEKCEHGHSNEFPYIKPTSIEKCEHPPLRRVLHGGLNHWDECGVCGKDITPTPVRNIMQEKTEVIINRHSPMNNFETKEECAKDIVSFWRSYILSLLDRLQKVHNESFTINDVNAELEAVKKELL